MSQLLSPVLLRDECRGIYIPQSFANDFECVDGDGLTPETTKLINVWHGIPVDDLELLKQGPDNESYWQVWDEVLEKAWMITPERVKLTLYQDGNLFAIPHHPSFCFACWVGEPAEDCDNTHHEDGSVYAE